MTLTLDVLTNVNYSKIEAEVNKIRDRINKIPDKIKINIDVSFSENAAKKIESIQSGIEGVIRTTGASSAMKTTARDIDAIAQSAANMGKTTSHALRDQIDALTGVSASTKSARDSADAMKMAWAMQAEEAKKSAEATKASSQAQKNAETVHRNGITTLNKAEKALHNWTKARKSSNQDSREVYNNLKRDVDTLTEVEQAYKSGAASSEELELATKNVNKSLMEAEPVLKRNGDASRTLGERFSDLASKFASWLTVTQAIMLGVRAIQNIAKEAIAIDDAMTQMQIVTKASSGEMKQFGNTAANVAKQTASSITDVVNSATTYARLGYNMDASTSLAKYTSMISKVGDIEVSEVQSAITSIVKAFNIDANDTGQIESVLNKMVEVGNNFPVSVSELAEGLNNASSSLAAAGNSYEQSLALLAASNSTVQNISKASTGLRTIVARIRNTKTELDDLGEAMSDAEYNNIVQSLTKYKVSLTDSQGNLRNTYDIMKDIASVASELKETKPNDYAALAETLAGTRMQNIFFSIVENFGEAEKAMSQMDNSAGALEHAFGEYCNSMSAHIQQFKTQFQELSTTLVDSGLTNRVIDMGTGFLSLVTSLQKVGALIPIIVALVATLKSAKSIF